MLGLVTDNVYCDTLAQGAIVRKQKLNQVKGQIQHSVDILSQTLLT